MAPNGVSTTMFIDLCRVFLSYNTDDRLLGISRGVFLTRKENS